ncbi:hypothetical protein GHT06_005863 [Daphnia sinensis]|uniref:ANK_REP_REGION domain-containing protein n=1 Tax=Daphnia sinensis TaxID=1820382 RepID=A0AAD5KHF1_9CRUS|nr:hypothetical protein GHT06_005863 [Daphnia sinensis]
MESFNIVINGVEINITVKRKIASVESASNGESACDTAVEQETKTRRKENTIANAVTFQLNTGDDNTEKISERDEFSEPEDISEREGDSESDKKSDTSERYELAIVSDSENKTDSETERERNFGDYGFCPHTSNRTAIQEKNTTENATKCNNCKMKTIPTLSAARADAVRRRAQAITRLSNGENFLDMVYAPREEIRKFILKKLGPAAWDYDPKAEFLNKKFNERTLLHRSVKLEKLDITDLLLSYGADPDIEENGRTIAHIAAAQNNKLLVRILRYHKCTFAAYNCLGETPLMVAIAYGHEDLAHYLWCSSNVAQKA